MVRMPELYSISNKIMYCKRISTSLPAKSGAHPAVLKLWCPPGRPQNLVPTRRPQKSGVEPAVLKIWCPPGSPQTLVPTRPILTMDKLFIVADTIRLPSSTHPNPALFFACPLIRLDAGANGRRAEGALPAGFSVKLPILHTPAGSRHPGDGPDPDPGRTPIPPSGQCRPGRLNAGACC